MTWQRSSRPRSPLAEPSGGSIVPVHAGQRAVDDEVVVAGGVNKPGDVAGPAAFRCRDGREVSRGHLEIAAAGGLAEELAFARQASENLSVGCAGIVEEQRQVVFAPGRSGQHGIERSNRQVVVGAGASAV